MKPFKTLEEQIDLLMQRGLIISNRKKTKRYLLQHSYYNVINVYSRFFQFAPDKYIEGTTFDEIRAVHVFDSEMKSTFFKYLLECEKHFKSILAYRFSETYGDTSFAYLKTSSFTDKDLINLSATISQLSNTITKNLRKKESNAIKHYTSNHLDVPMWVLINQLTFGQVVHMYAHFNNKLKNAIARDVAYYLEDNTKGKIIFEPDELQRFLFNLIDIRNCVAHNNKLFNFKAKNNVKYIPKLHMIEGITKTAPRQDLFNCFIMMQALLEKEQYTLLHNTIRKRIRNLDHHIQTISVDQIIGSLGFPTNWHKNPIKEQPQ